MVGESLRDTISDSASMLRQTMLEIHSEFVYTWRFFYIDRWLSFLACACHHPVATASFSMLSLSSLHVHHSHSSMYTSLYWFVRRALFV